MPDVMKLSIVTPIFNEKNTIAQCVRRVLAVKLPLEKNSDDFVFDNQMLAQILWLGYQIAEVSCPTLYFAEASSINLRRSLKYGFGCLNTAINYRLAKMNLIKSRLFPS